MTAKIKSNLVATLIIAAFLGLGCIFGYVFLGGSTATPSNANVPTENIACLICDGGHGGAGDIPPPLAAVGSGGGGNLGR